LADGRHHKASRDVQIVLVPYPVGGSPAPLHRGKPPAYPPTQRESRRPRTKPSSKADATKRLLDAIIENEAAARSMLRPLPLSAMVPR
jgi:hypothetical protein